MPGRAAATTARGSSSQSQIEEALADAGHEGMRPRYAGREAAASPATGLAKRHKAQQEALVAVALGLADGGKTAQAQDAQPQDLTGRRKANMATEVKVPTLGESVTEATIGEWLKQPGDAGRGDEPIASLETDKVAVEVPSPVAGVMGELKAEVGDTVEVGAVIATIEEGAARRPRRRPRRSEGRPRAAKPRAPTTSTRGPTTLPRRQRAGRSRRTLSPAVRRAVLEHGVDPDHDQGHRQGRPPDQGRRARRGQGQEGAAPAPAARRASALARSAARRRRRASAARSA